MKSAMASQTIPPGSQRSPGPVTTVEDWFAAHPDLARRDREVLLGRAAGLTRAQIMARPERRLEGRVAGLLDSWAERRRQGEPVAYILGEKPFRGLVLEVSPAVLVPRPETELLVEVAMEEAGSPSDGARVLELGTGSGAVAIALAHEAAGGGLPLQVTATDVSADALAVAGRNARRHGVEIRLLRSDWYSNVHERYHLIVSNPPYVADGDPHLRGLRHEPPLALNAGPAGLDAIRAIVAAAPDHLEPGGTLALEHGYDQAAAVRALLGSAGFVAAETFTDLAGLDRVTRGRLPGRSPWAGN